MTTSLTDHRCSCGRLLFKGELRSALIEIKCRRCGEFVRFSPRYMLRQAEVVVSSALVLRDAHAQGIEGHGLWMDVDELWRCRKVSDGLLAYTLSTPEMIVGTRLVELLDPEYVIASGHDLIQATAERAPFVLERIAFAQVPDRILRMHGIPHFRENGEASGYTLIFEG